MAAKPEAKVKAAVKKYLKTLPDCWWYMPVQAGYGSMGVPDFIICLAGRFLAVETKAPGRERCTTPLQERNIAAINDAGGTAIVASCVDDVIVAIVMIRLHG